MSLSEIFDKYYPLLLVPVTSLITYWFARKKEKVSLDKSRSEATNTGIETIEKAFDFKVKSDTYYELRISTLQTKLDAISEKLTAMTEQSEKWESLHQEVLVEVNEMKAQLTIWKTISR